MGIKRVENGRDFLLIAEKDSVKPLIVGTLAKVVNAAAELTNNSAAEVVRCMMLASIRSGFAMPGFEFEAYQSPEDLLMAIKAELAAPEGSVVDKTAEVKPKAKTKVKADVVETVEEPVVAKSFEIHMPAALKKKVAPKA